MSKRTAAVIGALCVVIARVSFGGPVKFATFAPPAGVDRIVVGDALKQPRGGYLVAGFEQTGDRDTAPTQGVVYEVAFAGDGSATITEAMFAPGSPLDGATDWFFAGVGNNCIVGDVATPSRVAFVARKKQGVFQVTTLPALSGYPDSFLLGTSSNCDYVLGFGLSGSAKANIVWKAGLPVQLPPTPDGLGRVEHVSRVGKMVVGDGSASPSGNVSVAVWEKQFLQPLLPGLPSDPSGDCGGFTASAFGTFVGGSCPDGTGGLPAVIYTHGMTQVEALPDLPSKTTVGADAFALGEGKGVPRLVAGASQPDTPGGNPTGVVWSRFSSGGGWSVFPVSKIADAYGEINDSEWTFLDVFSMCAASGSCFAGSTIDNQNREVGYLLDVPDNFCSRRADVVGTGGVVDAADKSAVQTCVGQQAVGPCAAYDLVRDGVINRKDVACVTLMMGFIYPP